MTYAEGTSVPVERSKFELDGLLRKHGASQRVFGDDDVNGRAVVCFTLDDRQYRLEIPLPKFEAYAIRRVKVGRTRTRDERRSPEEHRRAHEQACRERYRAVVLLVKAKLELVALGVSSVEREFLADLVLVDGRRVHEAIKSGVSEQYLTGTSLPLLGPGAQS